MTRHDKTPGDPDDVMMARYANGELGAFEELYSRYEKRVYGFCLRFLGNPDAAGDAFQNVFVKVIAARRKYRARGRFAQWIFTIARRVCIDQLRNSGEPAVGNVSERPPAREPVGDPVEDLARKHEAERLLASIPFEQREALLLSRYFGFKYGEIAEMIGSTEAAVKQKIYRALQSITRAREDAVE